MEILQGLLDNLTALLAAHPLAGEWYMAFVRFLFPALAVLILYRAVRSLLGGVRLSAPALVCGGTLAYNFSEGSGTALCSFEGMEESVLKMLPSLSGVGIALQMRDGSTRAVRGTGVPP